MVSPLPARSKAKAGRSSANALFFFGVKKREGKRKKLVESFLSLPASPPAPDNSRGEGGGEGRQVRQKVSA